MLTYFLKTTFIEKRDYLDLISIAIVGDDITSFFAINKDCNLKMASNHELAVFLQPLGLNRKGWEDAPDRMSPRIRENYSRSRSSEVIADQLLEFLGDQPYELWGNHCARDQILLEWLLGGPDRPEQLPSRVNDIAQEADRLGLKFPAQDPTLVHPVNDALYIKKCWQFLISHDHH